MTSSRCAGIGVERVRVVAEARDRQALAPRSRRRARVASPPTGWRRRCGASRHSAGSARSCAASRRSRCSRSRWRPSSRRPRSSGVSGNGAVSRPSLIGRASTVGAPAGAGSRIDVHPAAEPRALGDGVVDEHLVVAVGERRDSRRRRTGRPGDDVGVDGPEMGARRCRRTPRRGRPAAPPRPGPAGPMSAGFLIRISFGRSRWPIHIWSGCSESQATDATRTRRSRTGASSCGRR